MTKPLLTSESKALTFFDLLPIQILVYNGQRFYRQGLTNPPEYENNSTGADTRAAGDLDCKSKASNQNTGDDTGIAPRGLAEKIPVFFKFYL